MSKMAMILFAHGARDPEWASPLRRILAAIFDRSPDLRVELAFLEFMMPSLRGCAAALVADGFERIVIVPMFIAQGGHLKNDLPLIIDELRRANPQVVFELALPIGEEKSIVHAMAVHVLALSVALRS